MTLTEIIRRVRRNHALEHATVTLMLEEGVRGPLGGYSTPNGFFVIGSVSTEDLTRIVGEALARLTCGHTEMAISPHCGTNLAVGVIISGLLTKVVIGRRNRSSWKRTPLVLASVVVGALLSRPFGNVIQRRYTTLSEMDGLQVVSISGVLPGSAPRLHRVATRLP